MSTQGANGSVSYWVGCLTFCLAMLLSVSSIAWGKERIRYYINDPAGSPARVVDSDGVVVAQYRHAPFGEQLATKAPSNNKAQVGFVGGVHEANDLEYLKHRYYNPVLGRFYQPDPVGYLAGGLSQVNRYAYGLNDAYHYVDKDGRNPLVALIALSIWALDNLRSDSGDPRVTINNTPPSGAGDAAVMGYAIGGALVEATLVRMATASGVTTGLTSELALNPAAQRALLRDALEANGTGLKAHHIVPLEAVTRFPELMAKAAQGGFNLNGKGNGILLGAADHVGGHPQYNKVVLEQLARIPPNLSPARTAAEVQRISNVLRESIGNGTFGPWF